MRGEGVGGLVYRKCKDHDPIKPGVFCSDPLHYCMQVLSYPIPPAGVGPLQMGRAIEAGELDGWTLMVRLIPGDPTTLREVPLNTVACFAWDRYGTAEAIRAEFPMWQGGSGSL